MPRRVNLFSPATLGDHQPVDRAVEERAAALEKAALSWPGCLKPIGQAVSSPAQEVCKQTPVVTGQESFGGPECGQLPFSRALPRQRMEELWWEF